MREEEVLDREDGDVDGECVVCGKYKARIDKGQVAPCFAWRRVKETEDEDEE